MINSNMSGPSKSLDKSKRFAGVKTNDFVNKTRANEANRSAIRPQGWANLGKINSRRVPPPANLPSLKSETGVTPATFDPATVTPNHGWTSNENPLSPNVQAHPTQQQIDSLPVNSPTPPSSADNDKSRLPPSWNTITAGATSTEPPPNPLALNDFPRLATNKERKPQSETLSTSQNPTFRPANLATWKEGGGNAASRGPTLVNDASPSLPSNPGANHYHQPQNLRMYPPQMWNYNPYPPVPLMPPAPPRMSHLNEYKTPTILRNKDIEDLSRLTDNTWANTTQEVNYEEKIRFSDDEDFLESNAKTSRLNNQFSSHTRLIQDDEHLKQMQDSKNSELINALTIAKQRRDEQERHLRNEQLMANYDEQKPIPGYQTRPLLSSNEQENYPSRLNSNQSSFAMKSWSDQMDSFNYSSLHDASVAGHLDANDRGLPHQYSPSQSESSSQSITKTTKTSTQPPVDNTDYSNDQWENWNEPNANQPTQILSNKLKINRVNRQSLTTKARPSDRQTNNNTSRAKPSKTQPVWRPESPIRTNDTPELKSQQEPSSYKAPKQRYQTANPAVIDTASIPPLMSVRSDLPPTDYYENENLYYETNLPNQQRYNRGYTTLGSYGRYRRSGTVRQQQYANYHTNPTAGVSSAPLTRPKKNGSSAKKSEPNNSANGEETIKHSSSVDEESVIKPLQSLVLSPKLEAEKSNGSAEPKPLLPQTDNSSTKIEKKKSAPTTATTTKSQKRPNKEQSNYPQDQSYQAPRHRNNYARAMQDYDAMPMSTTHNYYGTARRTGQNSRHNHLHDLSAGYYYDQSQSHYNNRYNYSTDSYQQRANAKTSKPTRSKRQPTANKTSYNNNNNNNFRHHSTSDNDQKEGEEWETASESSTNMRNGHYETSGMNEIKNSNHRGRTPPKKSFSNQRPNARQIFKYTNA